MAQQQREQTTGRGGPGPLILMGIIGVLVGAILGALFGVVDGAFIHRTFGNVEEPILLGGAALFGGGIGAGVGLAIGVVAGLLINALKLRPGDLTIGATVVVVFLVLYFFLDAGRGMGMMGAVAALLLWALCAAAVQVFRPQPEPPAEAHAPS